MKKLNQISLALIAMLVFAACAPTTVPSPVAVDTATTSAVTEGITSPTETSGIPTIAVTLIQVTVPPTAPLPTNLPTPDPSLPEPPPYLDDRSTAGQVVNSYFNAIERGEYARAYYYWNDSVDNAGPFDTFAKQLEGVQRYKLDLKPITSSGAAGSVYSTVPGTIQGTLNGKDASWAFCYQVKLPQPGNFGEPPIHPQYIEKGRLEPVDGSTTVDAALKKACSGFDQGGQSTESTTPSLDIDTKNFVDNRSGVVEIVSSYLNAINLKQYVRAYSYFAAPEDFPGNFDRFQEGYKNTESTEVEFGQVRTGVAAGNRYYTVPTYLKSTLSDGKVQHFVGCYVAHQSDPALFAAPPFVPLGIQLGRFREVDPSSDIQGTMIYACNNIP